MKFSRVIAAFAGTIRFLIALFLSVLPVRLKETPALAPFQSNAAHVVSGILESLVALNLFALGFSRYMNEFSRQLEVAFAAGKAPPGMTEGDLRLLGAPAYIIYLLYPPTLVYLGLFAEGLLRAVAAGMAGHRHGLSALWAIDRLAVIARKKYRHARLRRLIGPPRLDHVRINPKSGLLEIMSNEDKPWSDHQALQHSQDFYILQAKDFVPLGSFHRYRYLFRRMHPGEIIRGSIATVPGVTKSGTAPHTPVQPVTE